MHRYNREYDIALEYFERALDISKEKKYEVGIIQAEGYIGYSYLDKKEFKKALVFAKRVLAYSLKKSKPISIALRCRSLGDIYSGLKNLSKALYYYDLSLKYSIAGQNDQYIIYAYLRKADLFFNFNKYKEANKEIELGLELAVKNNSKYLRKNCFLSSAKIKFSLKKQDESFQHMHKAFLLQEEISRETQKKGLIDAQALFRTSLLEQENQFQEKQLEIKNAKIRETEAKSRLQNVIIFVAILLLIGGFVFVRTFRKKNSEINKKNEELENQNTQILAQKEVLEETLGELKKTQTQLIESEKMASLGNLVAGVAHEMNTPIGIGVQATSGIVNRSSQIINEIKLQKIDKNNILKYIEHTYHSSKLALSNLQRTSELIKSFKGIPKLEVRNNNGKVMQTIALEDINLAQFKKLA